MGDSKWFFVCDEGHLYECSPDLADNSHCKYCGSKQFELFSDARLCLNDEIKPIGTQTIVCKNLDTGHVWHEKIKIYKVKSVFKKG